MLAGTLVRVRHAGADALDRLQPLLIQLREIAGLKEMKRGTSYRGSKALVHFHEDGPDLFADVRSAGTWERLRVTTACDHSSRTSRAAEKTEPGVCLPQIRAMDHR